MGHYATEMRGNDDPEYYRDMYARQCGEVVRLKLRVNALLDAIQEHAPRATAKRIIAAANVTPNAVVSRAAETPGDAGKSPASA